MDKSVASFFVIFRFLIALSLMNLVGLSFLIVRQLLSSSQSEIFSSVQCGQTMLPCFMVYSGFHENLSFNFSMNFLMFNLIGFFACLYQWRQHDKISAKNEVYNDGKYPISKLLFDGWIWSTNKLDMMRDYQNNILAEI